MARSKALAMPLAVALVLSVLFYGAVDAQGIKQTFGWIIARTLTVNTTSTLTGNVTTGADVSVGDDLAVVDDTTFTGNIIGAPATVQVIAQDTVINADNSYQPISSTAATSTANIVTDTSTAGQWITLVNVGSQTITLTDTGTLKLSANLALGASDSVRLIFDGTNWVQVSTSNN